MLSFIQSLFVSYYFALFKSESYCFGRNSTNNVIWLHVFIYHGTGCYDSSSANMYTV